MTSTESHSKCNPLGNVPLNALVCNESRSIKIPKDDGRTLADIIEDNNRREQEYHKSIEDIYDKLDDVRKILFMLQAQIDVLQKECSLDD